MSETSRAIGELKKLAAVMTCICHLRPNADIDWTCQRCKLVNLIPEIEAIESHTEQAVREMRERAYLQARGGDNRFEKHGARQAYWKGRSDAATEIRALPLDPTGEAPTQAVEGTK